MPSCENCSAALNPGWKFCVYCGTPAIPGAVRPEPVELPRVNPLAILALALACIGGFPALIFGHLAMAQIRLTGERGMLIARIATGLGYLWLVVAVMVLYVWLSGAAA
jgi:hypothetical protein